jgi:HlyD family secretion protein
VAVQIGHSNGLVTQILSGIDAGETVIVHPDDRIQDGVRVALQ